jgi:hypothetical protein
MDELLINIGTEKCCCFVRMSQLLIKKLRAHPLLYYAVEEALECARIGYYGIGMIAFSQLLNLFNEETPEDRHRVAHEFLKQRPAKPMFDSVVERFKIAAAHRSDKEIRKVDSGGLTQYRERVLTEWGVLVKELQVSNG